MYHYVYTFMLLENLESHTSRCHEPNSRKWGKSLRLRMDAGSSHREVGSVTGRNDAAGRNKTGA